MPSASEGLHLAWWDEKPQEAGDPAHLSQGRALH
jgi:hypothetical protein